MDKVKNPRGGVVSFPEGGCKFFKSEGGYPPSNPKKFLAAAHVIFDSSFFIKNNTLNDIISPPQAKIEVLSPSQRGGISA